MSASGETPTHVGSCNKTSDLEDSVDKQELAKDENPAFHLSTDSPNGICCQDDADSARATERMQPADDNRAKTQTQLDGIDCLDYFESDEKCVKVCENCSDNSKLDCSNDDSKAEVDTGACSQHHIGDGLIDSDALSNAPDDDDDDVESDFATIDISDSLKLPLSDAMPCDDVETAPSAETRNSASPNGKPMHDIWHSVFEIRRREFGYRSRYNGTSAFTQKFCGSINFTKKLQRYATLKGHSGCVNALHFNESGTLLASGSDDLDIHIWNWRESKSSYSFTTGHRSNVFQCKFMPFTNDSHLVSCARDGMVRLAEISSTGSCRDAKKLASHRGAAHKLAMLSDSSHVFYSCGEDAVIFEIDLRQDKPNKLCVAKENNRKVELYSIHANPFKSQEFVVGGRDYYVRIYDTRNINKNINEGIVKKFCPRHLLGTESKANITCAVYNFDGTEILGSYNDEDIYLFDNTQQEVTNHHLRHYAGHRNNATVKGVNFYGPKSEFIVSGSDCGNVFLWEKNTEQIINYFAADEGGVVNVLEPHPHFAILATSGLDHDVKVWMPLAEEPTSLSGLEEVVRKNGRERETDHNEPDVDGRMFFFLMQRFRRSVRRQMRDLDEDPGSSSSEDSNELEDEDEDGEDQDEPVQCSPS